LCQSYDFEKSQSSENMIFFGKVPFYDFSNFMISQISEFGTWRKLLIIVPTFGKTIPRHYTAKKKHNTFDLLLRSSL
jgi:hypothetical protein